MKKVFCVLLLLLTITAFVSCDNNSTNSNDNSDDHIHSFSMWSITKEASCTEQGIQSRSCSSCGFVEQASISAISHTVVTDNAVVATCTTEGKTAGSHCSVCNTIIVPQTTIAAKGHTEVTDPAIAATCTTDGKTEGKHCSVCNTIIVKQNTITAIGHVYDKGAVVSSASCTQKGTIKYTCTALNCGHSYTENYSLPIYTATEINDQALSYVGEIITYDKNSYEQSLGTAFLFSSDGKIITNYHVIDDAYSAKVTINGTAYKIVSVLAYDETIDLAVLKINATGLTAANICKKPVKVGETVYAIGSSRGLTNTFSQGIITYADRVVDGVSHIQHDASIAHGNSGGPLINQYGEVIGINTWGVSDSQNLNFAVFTDELDNLVYGTPMTLAELYEQNHKAYDVLINYICTYGTYDSTNQWYEIRHKESNPNYDHFCSLVYNTKTNTVFISDGHYVGYDWSAFIALTLERSSNLMYYTAYYSENDIQLNSTWGYLDASTFSISTSALPYISFQGLEAQKDSLMKLYCTNLGYLLYWFECQLYLDNVGVTLSDLGFVFSYQPN